MDVFVDDCNVACVEDVSYIAGDPPADDASSYAVSVVYFACVVGFFERADETAADDADMASEEIEFAVS